jgi:UDP-2-acetamido-3-amino-2,3-dideoxy-glucuronate N-acetyltransferase
MGADRKMQDDTRLPKIIKTTQEGRLVTSPALRDDRQLLRKIGLVPKILLGFSMYIPVSWFKITVFKLLGAQIGENVYIGPGSLLLSGDFHNVAIGDGVFLAPGVMISVNNLTVGAGTTIGYQCLFVGDHLTIGAGCNISNRSFIESSYAPVSIGDSVTIAASVIISSHDGAYRQTYGLDMKKEAVRINKGAFIGNNAIILPGIEVGEQAIVGAGAVVTKNVGPRSVVAGVPARIIKPPPRNSGC